jgi:hypothetical protein
MPITLRSILPAILTMAVLPAASLPGSAPQAGPSSEASPPAKDPAARVFRGILEGEASPMVFLAVGKSMVLAYDERGGSLFQAWNGKALPASGPGSSARSAGAAPKAGKGALATASPAASTTAFRASGAVFHRRTNARPWEVRGPGGKVKVTVALEGVSARGDLAALEWILRLPDGRSIRVTEVPMFDDHYGDEGLFRNFTVTGIPPGHSVRLDLDGRGMPETWGGGGDGGIVMEGGRRYFVQEADGQTPLKVTWSRPLEPGEAAPAASW